MLNIENKKKIVSEIIDNIKTSSSVIVVEFNNLSVKILSLLRNELTRNEAKFKVYKNNCIFRAFNKLNFNLDKKYFVGSNALIFSKNLITGPKILIKFNKSHNRFIIKFGIINNEIVDQNKIKIIANIPNKEVLISKILGYLKFEIMKLINIINQIKKEK